MVNERVLISGAGIAGPALAYWLHRFGFRPTLLERATAPRSGGQAVDVRGVALDVLREMGLYTPAHDLRTRMRGVSVLDADGRETLRSEERSFSGGRFDSGDIEIFRDDLVRLLCDTTRDQVEYLWGDSIAAVEQSQEEVRVSFEGRPARTFDLLVAADGLHSNVRRLVFGDEGLYVRSFGIGLAIFSTPNLLGLQDWQMSYRDDISGYLVYPNRDNSQLRVNLGFGLDSPDAWRRSIEAQKALVAERCGHLRWEIPRLIEAMRDTADFYLGDIAQVRMEGWSRGRAVLLGDAGYCPSPFSGQGTSLALVGAYVLARELARTPGEIYSAFERYESRMRPYVEINQALLNLERKEPSPDEELEKAKWGIALDDLGEAPSRATHALHLRVDDLSGQPTRELLTLHLAGMQQSSPAGRVFALDLSGLLTPDVTVWSAWDGPALAGIAALKEPGDGTGELKSMRTHPEHLRKGVASALLEHIIDEARRRGLRRLSLETGSGAAFEPALALYRKRGFRDGEAFGAYDRNDFNQFLHLIL